MGAKVEIVWVTFSPRFTIFWRRLYNEEGPRFLEVNAKFSGRPAKFRGGRLSGPIHDFSILSKAHLMVENKSRT